MLRFHLALFKPDRRISRIRLSDKDAVISMLMLSLAREVDRHPREPHLLPFGSRRQAKRNGDWLETHWNDLLPAAFGKFIAVADQEAYIADSPEAAPVGG